MSKRITERAAWARLVTATLGACAATTTKVGLSDAFYEELHQSMMALESLGVDPAMFDMHIHGSLPSYRTGEPASLTNLRRSIEHRAIAKRLDASDDAADTRDAITGIKI